MCPFVSRLLEAKEENETNIGTEGKSLCQPPFKYINVINPTPGLSSNLGCLGEPGKIVWKTTWVDGSFQRLECGLPSLAKRTTGLLYL